MRKREGGDGRGKALDLWQPPQGAGQPLFCVATTFTFHADFFEVECLGRFLQMDTHPQESESIGYLIEREDKLAAARVCVLADRRHATAKESLRWDVLPVVVPHAVQHAKLSLLCWANHVRVVIGSGNLSEPGYRKNLEVFGCLEASRHEAGMRDHILEAIGFLEQVAARALGVEDQQGPRQRLRDTLASARGLVRDWPQAGKSRTRVFPVFGGLGRSIVEQLGEGRPSGSPPRNAHILSPFFDTGPGAGAVVAALAEVLAKRGERVCRFYVSAEDLPDGRVCVKMPRDLIDFARGFCETFVHKLRAEQDNEVRFLHAKMLALENDDWELILLGSSNFTRAGLGVTDGSANLEANLAYLVRQHEPDHRALQSVWPEVGDEVDLDSPAIVWEPAFDPDDPVGTGSAPLPAAFREALFDAGAAPPHLILSFDEGLPATWTIRAEQGQEIMRSDEWSGQPGNAIRPWTDPAAPILLQVQWGEPCQTVPWPVNVVDPGALPPPAALRDLTLEELLEVLASTRPLHQSVVDMLRKRGHRSKSDVELDPHKRVNTETFLLRRTKRVALALERLRERLERPAASAEALDWRLRGPVGPRLGRSLPQGRSYTGRGALLPGGVGPDAPARAR